MAQHAGYRDRYQEVEGEGPEAQPDRLVGSGERDEGMPPADVDEGVDHGGSGVRGHQCDRQQGDIAVQTLGEHPGPDPSGDPCPREHTEHRGDHVHRQLGGVVGDEVGRPVGTEAVKVLGGELTHAGLELVNAVVAYIDFNAISARIVDRPEDYPHGSARHYAKQAGPKWLCRSWIEGEVQECSGLDRYRPESYPDVFGGAASEPGRALVARRIAKGGSRIDPLDELLEAAPVAVLDWMNRKAKLADGTQTGVAVCDAGALQSTIHQRRSLRPWILLARGQAFDAWNQIETGLLRDLCGLTLREISLSTGRAESTVARLCERQRHRLTEDSEYASRVSNIASVSLRMGASIGAAANRDNCDVSGG